LNWKTFFALLSRDGHVARRNLIFTLVQNLLQPLLLTFVLPMPTEHAAMTILPVAAELAVLLFSLRQRWVAAGRSLQPLAAAAA